MSGSYTWLLDNNIFEYKEDKTQLVKNSDPIEYTIHIDRNEDPALMSFIERIADLQIADISVMLSLTYKIDTDDILTVYVRVNDRNVDDKSAREIDKRIKDSNLLFLYHSTSHQDDYCLSRGRPRMFYELIMSAPEKRALDQASTSIERKLRRLAKVHTDSLKTLIGRLSENYDVEVSPLEGFPARRIPLGINLRDRNVEAPLYDWGNAE